MKPICPRCQHRPLILLGITAARTVKSSLYRCTFCKARFALRDDHEAYKVADCQAKDGSVLVSWEGCEWEGQAEADEGTYSSLALALKVHPDAIPVCPGCIPWLDDLGAIRHEEPAQRSEGCLRLSMGVVSTFVERAG